MLKLREFSRSSFVLLASFAPGALLGCAGAPAKPVAAPVKVVSPPPVAKEEAPDLTPVAAPAELFALARFQKPKSAVETVAAWANFPVTLRDVLPSDLHGLEQVVAWDAPVELVAALDPLGEGRVPEPLATLSVGLTSLDAALDFARSQGVPTSRLRAGVYRIGNSADLACAVGVAVGSAPARLVCGHRARDVDGLFDYATRGLPNEPLPNLDFQVELRLDGVKKRYGSQLGFARLAAGGLLREVQLDNARFDRALSDVAYGLVDETLALVHDLDKVRIDGAIDSQRNAIDLRLALKFVGQQSWLVQTNAETLPMSEPPPDLFWQLPADSTTAAFSVGYKPGRLKPIGRTLGELFGAYLDTEKVPAKVRDQASQAVEGLFDQNTKQVRAQGELSEVPTDPLLAADYSMFGWQIAALDGDAQALTAVFDGLTRTLASRDLVSIAKKRLGIQERDWPKFSAHAVTVRGFKPGAKAYRVDVSRDLFLRFAKGRHRAVGKTPSGKAALSAPISLVVASDGAHAWVGISPDEKALIERLEALKDPKAPVLRAREGLETLRNTPRVSGGFLTLERFLGQLISALGAGDDDARKILSALPHHGQTPIIVTSAISAEGPELGVSLAVPRAAVEDIGTLVPVLALMVGKH